MRRSARRSGRAFRRAVLAALLATTLGVGSSIRAETPEPAAAGSAPAATRGPASDPYLLFAAGGSSGQLLVLGVPSLRLLKLVAVFSPEAGQGFGFSDATARLLGSRRASGPLRWADAQHPALSERGGSYDGRHLFLNDKANARVALVDLEDFVTKQIVSSGLIATSGATVVTPDSEYVIEVSQYPTPLGGLYAPLEEFDSKYRGAAIFWKFDDWEERIQPEKSWAVELPPYMQGPADAGKGESAGWLFVGSFNAERARGGNLEGKPSLGQGAASAETDYLHLLDWRKAEQLIGEGKGRTLAGMRLLPLEVASQEGALVLVPSPKNPYGVDVTPDGAGVVVAGRLDSKATVYDVAAMKARIEAGSFATRDPYDLPVLDFDASIRGQIELGLAPMRSQFDDRGFVYTSLFTESKVARWSLADLKLVEKLPVHYNAGHLVAAESDTVSPQGDYLVSLNGWSLDRSPGLGPLPPPNLQLLDIGSQPMALRGELPLPIGEAHSAQMMRADRLQTVGVYEPPGTHALQSTSSVRRLDARSVREGKEGVEREGLTVRVSMTLTRGRLKPDVIRVKQGDWIVLHVTNLEQAPNASHGFALAGHDVNLVLAPGQHANVSFAARQAGVFPFYDSELASPLQLETAGYLLVEPR